MKSIVYIVLLTFSISIFADTDPFLAQKGTVLQQESWVFSPAKALEVRNKLIDLDTNVKLNDSLQKSLTLEQLNGKIQQDKINLVMDQNDKLAHSLNDERTVSNWERIGYFALGIAATVLAGFAIKKAGQ